MTGRLYEARLVLAQLARDGVTLRLVGDRIVVDGMPLRRAAQIDVALETLRGREALVRVALEMAEPKPDEEPPHAA